MLATYRQEAAAANLVNIFSWEASQVMANQYELMVTFKSRVPYSNLLHPLHPRWNSVHCFSIQKIKNRWTHARQIRSPPATNSNPHQQYHCGRNSKQHYQETAIPRDGNEILLASRSRDKQILQILLPAGVKKILWTALPRPTQELYIPTCFHTTYTWTAHQIY